MTTQITISDKLQYQLAQKIMERLLDQQQRDIDMKNTKIAQLQAEVIRHQMREIEENIAIEEEVQCCLEDEVSGDEKEQVVRLSSRLVEREQEGVRLHLALFQKSRQVERMNQKLQQKEDLINHLMNKIKVYQSDESEFAESISSLQKELFKTKLELKSKQKASKQYQDKNIELKAKLSNLMFCQQKNYNHQFKSSQKNKTPLTQTQTHTQPLLQGQTLTQTQIQLEENKVGNDGAGRCKIEKEFEFKVMSENNKLFKELQKMKNILNNYDWKLFCLETQLDLSNKEKKQLKYLSQKTENKVFQLESTLKQQRIKLFSNEQQIQFYRNENLVQSQQLCQLYHKIQALSQKLQAHIDQIRSLQATIQAMNEQQCKLQDIQQLKYQLKQKTQEHNQLIKYVKQKSKQNHDLHELNQRYSQLLTKQRAQTSKLTNQISHLHHQLQSVNQNKAQYQRLLQQYNINIQNLQIQHYQSQQNIIQYQLQIQNLQESISNYQNELKQINQVLDQQNKQFTLNMVQLQMRNNTLEKDKGSLVNSIKVVNEEKYEIEIEYHEMKALNGYYIRKMEDYQRQISEIKYTQLTTETKKIQELQATKQRYRQINQELNAEISQLNQAKEQYLHENQSMQARLQYLRRDNIEMVMVIDDLREQQTRQAEQIQRLGKTQNQLSAQLLKLLAAQNKRPKAFEAIKAQHIQLYTQNQLLNSQLQTLMNKQKTLSNQLSQFQYELKESKSVIDFLTKELQCSESSKNQFIKSYNNLHKEKARLQEQRVQLNQKFIIQTIEMNNMKQQVREMQEMTNLRINEMNVFLSQQELKRKEYEEKIEVDDTLAFEILYEDDDSFEVVDERTSKSCTLIRENHDDEDDLF